MLKGWRCFLYFLNGFIIYLLAELAKKNPLHLLNLTLSRLTWVIYMK